MNRFLSLMLCLCLFCAGLIGLQSSDALADDPMENGFSYTVVSGGAVVTGYVNIPDMVELEIPSTLGQYPTIGIAESFGQKTFPDLTTLTIPGSVKSIETNAFFGCRSTLKKIYYRGTRAQWEAAVSGAQWLGGIEDDVTVICLKKAAVTFRVQYGAWNDGTTADLQVSLSANEGEETAGRKDPRRGQQAE